jgi:hypothetical protein
VVIIKINQSINQSKGTRRHSFLRSVKKPNEPQPQIARTATANRTNRNRKLHEPQLQTVRSRPQTARTATANRTNRDRKPHEPQPNRSVNLFLGSTVYVAGKVN